MKSGGTSQSTFAAPTGRITDPTGLPFPEAEAPVTRVSTGWLYKAVTNEVGRHVAPNLVEGVYRFCGLEVRPLRFRRIAGFARILAPTSAFATNCTEALQPRTACIRSLTSTRAPSSFPTGPSGASSCGCPSTRRGCSRPGADVMHANLAKTARLGERFQLRKEVMAANVLNHPDCQNLILNITNLAQAGVFTHAHARSTDGHDGPASSATGSAPPVVSPGGRGRLRERAPPQRPPKRAAT